MRTTVTLDDELLAQAEKLTGTTERPKLLREALEALIPMRGPLLARVGGGSQIRCDSR